MKYFLTIFVLVLSLATPAVAQQKISSLERLQTISSQQQNIYSPEKLAEVSARCPESQKKILVLQRQNNLLIQKRLSIYGDLQKEMKALEIRLARQGADASELDLLIGKQQVALENFTENQKNYDILISDLRAINCAENPSLYLAGISEIYKYQQKLQESARAVYMILYESPSTTFFPLSERLRI